VINAIFQQKADAIQFLQSFA